VTSSWFLLIFS